MSHSPVRTFRVFSSTSIDAKDEIEEKLETCHSNITNLLSNATSERERHDILTNQVSKGNAEHDDVCLGLFAIILVDRHLGPKATQELMMVNRDSLNVVLSRLSLLILEKFIKIEDVARAQILWFMNELIKINIHGTDGLFISLMKQIIGGDTTPKNVWLAENIVDILSINRAWMDKSPVLIQTTVFTYLRVIQDHFHPSFAAVRQKEVTVCVTTLREHFNECRAIGRDLVRLLMGVARIPEFERLWSDLIHKPQSLAPNFTGLPSLVQTRTSRKFLVSRLTSDMESKVAFLLLKVRFGQQKRYQDWFQRQYLSTPESQLLRGDLIRYICGCVHPSNDILCSDIIPRWAVIGWLLSNCTSRVASSYSYLALFWDWLFYAPDKNSVMDIEAGVLVMFNSLRNHPAITTTLLDFLCRIVKNFHPPMFDQVRAGVSTALKTILEKRVLASLAPIFDNPKFDPELLNLIRSTFPEFCAVGTDGKPPLPPDSGPMPPPPPSDDIIGEEPMIIEDDPDEVKGHSNIGDTEEEADSSGQDSLAIFSDEEDESNKHQDAYLFPLGDSPKLEHRDITEDIEKLDETLKDLVTQMQNSTTSDTEEKCERVEDIIDHLLSLEEFDAEVCTPLASCLVELFSENFSRSNLPDELSDEYLAGCIEQPLYVIFRKLCQGREEDDSFSVLLSLLAEMYTLQQRLGYHLLFYLAVPNPTLKESNWMVYESFAQSTQLAETYNCLMMDMKHCQDDDVNMLIYLVPHVYKHFPEHCIDNAELLNMIVAVLDSEQLQRLQCLAMTGQLIMMKKDSVLNVLMKSLEWETFEQYSTWHLLAVHDIAPDVALPLVANLSHRKHPEALTMFLLLFRHKKPTLDMVRHITARNYRDNDNFALSLLRHWVLHHENEITEHICTLLNKSKPRSTPPRKGLRQSVRSSQTGLLQTTQPTTLHLLGHLEELRKNNLPKSCGLFTQDSLIASLTYVQSHCDDSDKLKFSELFALVVEDSEEETLVKDLRHARKRTKSTASRSGTSGVTARLRQTQPSYKNESDSGSNSSSDEETVGRRRKKRQKVSKANDSSDSD
uniref:integrator complex subunit 3-like n=1 Tax=Styela clava TaxID=7725 RepID=UPI00193A444F|nr:integrator complex subunit 3-like [Styela clava]